MTAFPDATYSLFTSDCPENDTCEREKSSRGHHGDRVELRKAIGWSCPAKAVFHGVSYLANWHQVEMTSVLHCILGLSIFAADSSHSHTSLVFLVSHSCCIFSLYCPFLHMLLTFQMSFLVQDLSTSTLLIYWAGKVFIMAEFPVNHRMLSSILGLYLMGVRSIPLANGDNQNYLQIMPSDVPRGEKLPQVRMVSRLCFSCSLKKFMLTINVIP